MPDLDHRSISIDKLTTAIFFLYGLFMFGSTFSIALAQSALGLSLILFVVYIIITRYNPFPSTLKAIYIPVALLLIWEFLAAFMGNTPLRSASMLREEWLFCAIPIGIWLCSKEHYRERLILILVAGTLMISLYAILQHFTGVHWFKSNPLIPADDFGYRVRGIFSHTLTFGNYFGVVSLFLLGYGITIVDRKLRNRRTFIVTTASLAMIATVLSYSRTVIAGMVLAILLMGFLMGKKHFMRWLAILVAATILIWFTMPGLIGRFGMSAQNDLDQSYEGSRFFIWGNSSKIITDHPIFGVGAGNFREAYETHLRDDIPENRKHSHAHNDFLNVAASSGLPAMLFYLTIWVIALYFFWNRWRRQNRQNIRGSFSLAALLGSTVFLIASLTESNFSDEEVRQILMFIWASGLWPLYHRENNNHSLQLEA